MKRLATAARNPFDLILVGGGLQNGLIALSALHTAPGCRIALVEAEAVLGGNHTWCVHAQDVSSQAQAWFEPLIVRRWSGYDVQFPGLSRTLHSPYAVITSQHFAQVVSAALAQRPGCELLTGQRAARLAADEVELADGRVLHGRRVVDARGPDASAFGARTGYQKFLGLEVRTQHPHGVERPVLMDATCSQLDGFRFFYVLPLADDRLLVEETRFSHSAQLDQPAARAAVERYAARFGRVVEHVREESGVLPMPWAGTAPLPAGDSPLTAGYRGGYFHPATGYSLPAAVRLAELVGADAAQPSQGLRARAPWRKFQRQHRAQVAYAQHLNRLLFGGFAAADMWRVFARFYRLPEPLIARFYAMSLSVSDRARVLLGRPPTGFSVSRLLLAGAES